jgi:hypothetical protein
VTNIAYVQQALQCSAMHYSDQYRMCTARIPVFCNVLQWPTSHMYSKHSSVLQCTTVTNIACVQQAFQCSAMHYSDHYRMCTASNPVFCNALQWPISHMYSKHSSVLQCTTVTNIACVQQALQCSAMHYSDQYRMCTASTPVFCNALQWPTSHVYSKHFRVLRCSSDQTSN